MTLTPLPANRRKPRFITKGQAQTADATPDAVNGQEPAE
jgi:hypothetical protein